MKTYFSTLAKDLQESIIVYFLEYSPTAKNAILTNKTFYGYILTFDYSNIKTLYNEALKTFNFEDLHEACNDILSTFEYNHNTTI